MVTPGRSFSAGTQYRYGFNGKELDKDITEGGAQDYGMRVYDTRLGRFLSMDPVADAFSWNSPYNFAENDPVGHIDYDGLEKAPPKIMEMVEAVSHIYEHEITQAKTQISKTTDKKIIQKLTVELDIAKRNLTKLISFRYKYKMNNAEAQLYYLNEAAPYMKKILDISPAGDIKVITTGKNFEDEPKSRLAAVGWLALDVFGGEILSGLGKANRAFRVIEGPGKEAFGQIIKKVTRINEGLKDYHVTAAVNDILGNPVVTNGRVWNHLEEVKNSLNGLGNQISKLNELIHSSQTSESVVNAATEFRNQLQKSKDAISEVLNRAAAKASK